MNKLEIFDPAMCCSTGVCGPSIDPDLLRISTVVNTLSKKGISVKRYNLSEEPGEYVKNKAVSTLLRSKGVKSLPITLVDGVIVMSGNYPSNKELSQFLGIDESDFSTIEEMKNGGECCGGNTGCC